MTTIKKQPNNLTSAFGGRILYVGAEALPFAATGGLGDVMGSLPAAIRRADPSADVRAVMPLYSSISSALRAEMKKVAEFTVNVSWRRQYCGVYSCVRDGVMWYFIDNEYYFSRGSLYGQYDDAERYAFFSLAVLEMLPRIEFFPDIMHLNDWQTALIAIYLRCRYGLCAEYQRIKTLYTIHNIEYQGKYDPAILGDVFGIGQECHWVMDYDGCLNLTKGAIVCCDRLSTVSARYAEELCIPYYAHGLAGIIEANRGKLSGIVNGIDTALYSPTDAAALPAPFDAEHPEGKEVCKASLQAELGLPVRADVPVIAMISRLASHKGFDLIRCVFDEMLDWEVQFVLLGTGEPDTEAFFRDAARRRPDKFAAVIAFDKALSKRIYAGSDLFLMPSASEPCGLSQMIASAYGSIPIVRETGGLADTIHPYSPESGEGNGVTFVSYNAHDMKDAVGRAVGLWYGEERGRLRKNAMQADFSWNASATRYLELYRSMLG